MGLDSLLQGTPTSQAIRSRVLGVLVKWPEPGQVKTRLAAAASPAWAAEVAQAFLLDLLDRLASFPARRVLHYSPADKAAEFGRLVEDRFKLTAQGEGDLGRRLGDFVRQEQRRGAEAIVAVGTDSPTLPLEFIEQAFAELQHADVVLGPATDGGFYLLGWAASRPPLLEGINWGSPTVLQETVARLQDPGWRLALLPPWYDLDTWADWQMLCGHLAALRRAGLDPGVPRTELLCRQTFQRLSEKGSDPLFCQDNGQDV